jgi:site-specific recombinase XerD
MTTGHLTTAVRKTPGIAPAPARPVADRAGLGACRAELRDAEFEQLVAASLCVLPETDRDRINRRRAAIRAVTTWLAGFEGQTWQQRWVASGIDLSGRAWAEEPSRNRRGRLIKGTEMLICCGMLHPDYPWLLDTGFMSLFGTYQRICDPAGFARVRDALRAQASRDGVAHDALYHLARIRIATGKRLGDISAEDVLDCHYAVRARRKPGTPSEALWRALHGLGIITGPARLKAAMSRGQLSVEELVDRHRLACRPVRDLLVDYVRERAPAMDYGSLSNLTHWLAELFWGDLERHHPGIDSLRLPPDVATAWKQRIATQPDGRPRGERYGLLTAVRAFYTDLNQWAYEDPARWAVWAAPCPVTRADLAARRKHKAQVTARMHARTRTLAEALPHLVTTARSRREHARALLAAALVAEPGTVLTIDNVSYRRIANRTIKSNRIPVQALAGDGDRPVFDVIKEETEAFWAWAVIEVLRLSGCRIEEVMELTHLSIRRYTQPTGEVVPLLQIAPSKLDAERVFPISPELAHVLAQIIDRVRGTNGTIPACSRFDTHERVYGPPLPHLFQRSIGSGHQVFSPETVRHWLERTLARAPLHDTDGTPLRFTPHDFRRLFATNAVNTGLPIHIAAALLGHRNLSTTQGYTAVYPDKVIRTYQAFIHTRRAERPTQEYREPTEAEWADFERHFTLRKVAYGNCDRPYGTPCVHEHACIRCPMLRTEPSRLPLLRELEDNLTERITEARQRTWLGEVEGLRLTLTALREKTQSAERLVAAGVTDTPQPLG